METVHAFMSSPAPLWIGVLIGVVLPFYMKLIDIERAILAQGCECKGKDGDN